MVTGQIISQEADCGGCYFTSSSPHLPIFQPPLPRFSSLGAWQHPSRWRVYFCFCLFTYSCIQLFRASQGLSFHHRMQIATAANPLSSLPCRHPTSPCVPQPLAVRTCLFLWAVQDQACSDQASLAPTLCPFSMHVKHNAAPASHRPSASQPPPPPRLLTLAPHEDSKQESEAGVTRRPSLQKWRLVGASLIELART